MTEVGRQTKYAYLVTLVGIVLSAIATAYVTLSPFLFSQTPRSQPPPTPGNFTGTVQLGNLAGAPQLGNMNPYGGLVSSFAILAVMIAVLGVLWLGLCLRKPSQVT